MLNMLDISIIIPSYNNLSTIENCLDSIFSQQTKYKYEVILVDSSDKEDYSVLVPKFPSLRMIKLNERTYPGTARNVGVKAAKGKLITFTDSDCVVFPDWINSTVDEHKKRERVLISGTVDNGTPRNLVGIAEHILEFSDFIPQRRIRQVEVIPTCNLSINKELFYEIGELEDVIKGSDILFSNRAIEKGVKVLLVPTIKIAHVNRCNLKKYLKNQQELGFGSYQVRKVSSLRGAFLTKSRWLSLLILPIRILTTFRKVGRTNAKFILLTIVAFPLIFLGLVYYTKGFWKSFGNELGK
jgi:GT2 family glycosyltransferase